MQATRLFGLVPHDLRGIYYRIGPGKLTDGNKVLHPFDGQGRIDKLDISPTTGITIRSKFVKTAEYLEELKAGEILYRGSFGSKPKWWNPFDFNIKNTANTSLVFNNGELLATWEGGLPHKLDPVSLKTQGLFDMGETAGAGQAFTTGHHSVDTFLGLGGHGVSAHPKTDPKTGRLVTYYTQVSFDSINIKVVEFEKDTWNPHKTTEFKMDGFTHCHDFTITENYYIFFAASLDYRYADFVLGKGPAECVRHLNKPTLVYFVPRNDSRKEIRTIEVEKCFVTHFVNSFEYYNGIMITIDAMTCDHVQIDSFPLIKPQRFTFNMNVSRCVSNYCHHKNMTEFPAINSKYVGNENRYFYASGSSSNDKVMDCIVKFDHCEGTYLSTMQHNSGTVKKMIFCTEPLFVEKKNAKYEDDGYLLFIAITEDGNIFCIANAKNMRIICSYRVDGTNIIGIHSLFVPV